MISLDSIQTKQLYQQCDSKSQVSTQGQENNEYHLLQSFSFSSCHQRYSKLSKSKVKSSLCRNFTEKGVCPYGSKCQFAHGTHELRINEDVNNSYKTKPCNAFLKKGHCQYGFRCNFVHSSTQPSIQEGDKWKIIYSNHRELFQSISNGDESRLFKLLE